MDIDRIRQNLRFRSGRTTNMSKRFPTRDPEKVEPPRTPAHAPPQHNKPRRKKRPPPPIEDETRASTQSSSTKVPSIPPTAQNGAELRKEPLLPSSVPDLKPSGSDSEGVDYDLRPSTAISKPSPTNVEALMDLLFSEGYLRTLTSDPQLLSRFTAFLNHFKPDLAPLVIQYIDNQKVIKAVEYANAVASTIPNKDAASEPSQAAQLSSSFQASSQQAFDQLLTTALPAWITYSLVETSTSCLTAEITNQSTPLTRHLVGGLSEVFCLTDPSQEDNSIVYASEEFYRLTGYGKEAVIGYNCRFLQGQKTRGESVDRLRDAIRNGEEICETLLNHRKDGTPFVNVLMLAPLHDDKGKVKYYLGAQVDASRLIEGGRGVEGFERFLLKKQMEENRGRDKKEDPRRNILAKLRDLSLTFDLEESATVQNHSWGNSATRGGDGSIASTERTPAARRRIQEDEEGSESETSLDGDDAAWNLSRNTSSGQLPGMYKDYLLVRPYPSLRSIFVSKGARKLGNLQQRPFMAHTAAPPATLAGLKEAFKSGAPVTAKIALKAQPGNSREGTTTGRWGKKDGPADHGKTCWISATPMLDGSDKVGVWMIVVVDNRSVGSNIGQKLEEKMIRENGIQKWANEASPQDPDLPIKPKPVGQSLEDEETDVGPEKDATTDGDAAVSVDEEAEDDKSQRSAAGSNFEIQKSNISHTESTTGSPPHLADSSRSHPQPDQPAEIVSPNAVHASHSTPRQRGPGKQDVGLRAMDYLTSRSPATKKRGDDNNVGISEGDEAIDWDAASPYSID